ncbi:MAG: MATE family efflux transporter [Oscillospiraceae bacterium]
MKDLKEKTSQSEKPMKKEDVTQNKMGTAPMMKLIASMSLPAMFSMLVQALYNIVDSMFVAKIGQDALNAVTLAFPIQMLIISVAVGTAIGINSLVSRKLGEKDYKTANSAASHGLILAAFTGVIFAILGIFCTKPFFNAFSDNPEIVRMGCDYIYVITICSFSVFLQINIEKTLQATGNMIYPMLFQLSGAITNIILDPIMIFGLLGCPAMGVRGAAIATVIGQTVATIFSLIVIFTKSHDVKIQIKGFKINWHTVKEIYKVGIPSIIMQSISSFLTAIMNVILKGFSPAAVNVFGVYYKLQSFVFMPVFGLTHGLMPILGYNYGAKNRKRLVSALKIGVVVALIIMTLGTLAFLIFPQNLLMIFSPDAELLRIGVPALRLISLSFIPAAVGIIGATLFQSIGHGTQSLLISILRQLVLLLPSAYIFSKIGLNFVWLAFPFAEFVTFAVTLFMIAYVFKKTINVQMPIPKTKKLN